MCEGLLLGAMVDCLCTVRVVSGPYVAYPYFAFAFLSGSPSPSPPVRLLPRLLPLPVHNTLSVSRRVSLN